MDLSEPVLGFCEMAQAMGVPARQVSDPDQIKAAVLEGLATTGPYLLDIVVEGMESG